MMLCHILILSLTCVELITSCRYCGTLWCCGHCERHEDIYIVEHTCFEGRKVTIYTHDKLGRNRRSAVDSPMEENDVHGKGCVSNVTGEFIAFDTTVYRKCQQYMCTPDGLNTTGETLTGCSETEMLCWNWMIEDTVSVGSMMYHRCQQYECTANDWMKVEDAAEDPRCEKKRGCRIHQIDEIAPYGTKSYFKCEQFECTEDGFQPTGMTNPECIDGKGACWNWFTNSPIKVGDKFFHKCREFECVDTTYTDILPTGVKDPRCTN